MFSTRTLVLALGGALLGAGEAAAANTRWNSNNKVITDNRGSTGTRTFNGRDDESSALGDGGTQIYFTYETDEPDDGCDSDEDCDDIDEDAGNGRNAGRKLQAYEGYQTCTSMDWQTRRLQTRLGTEGLVSGAAPKQLEFMCFTCYQDLNYGDMFQREISGEYNTAWVEVMNEDSITTVYSLEDAIFQKVSPSARATYKRRAAGDGNDRRKRRRARGLRRLQEDDDDDDDNDNDNRATVDFCVSMKKVKIWQDDTGDGELGVNSNGSENSACDFQTACYNLSDDEKCDCDPDEDNRLMARRRKLLRRPSPEHRRRARRARARARARKE